MRRRRTEFSIYTAKSIIAGRLMDEVCFFDTDEMEEEKRGRSFK